MPKIPDELRKKMQEDPDFRDGNWVGRRVLKCLGVPSSHIQKIKTFVRNNASDLGKVITDWEAADYVLRLGIRDMFPNVTKFRIKASGAARLGDAIDEVLVAYPDIRKKHEVPLFLYRINDKPVLLLVEQRRHLHRYYPPYTVHLYPKHPDSYCIVTMAVETFLCGTMKGSFDWVIEQVAECST